jgi:hypothetical protein
VFVEDSIFSPPLLPFLAALASQDAEEAPHDVLLSTRRFDDLGQSDALGAFHHRDHLGFLVAALGRTRARTFAPRRHGWEACWTGFNEWC